mmetsp:Transcript_89707/g.252943  ORF Transcript_89707/g.252943 Transcript_89707/m.252943 type:complete len:102 (+) Transcript_89707:137-442(+)|eukprot:CAMPEP_0117552006 /NCGR_PEP_ID=MMETSP0784-20121206/49487_1 /TAXON_ID=39447 /ORGANISM="" /LENGTH=101 /DNA_ID=CAMNT_0005349069 /DNA_START=124 /DNA_END=429 /DNA_ORIENTATION=-
MAGASSQVTKVLAAAGAGAMSYGFYCFAEPRLIAALSPLHAGSLHGRVYNSEDFASATAFDGSRPGWVFKVDHLGIGYYRDFAAPDGRCNSVTDANLQSKI